MANSTITLNDINRHIKDVKNIQIKLDVNYRFEQTISIPKKIGDYVKKEKVEEKKSPQKKIYNEGEIIEIPEVLTKNCNLDNFYIFGVSHDFSLIESLFFNLDAKFKFENPTKKMQIVSEFKDLIKVNLGHLSESKKSKIVKAIDTDNYNNDFLDICVYYFNNGVSSENDKINIICLDIDENKKYIVNTLSGENNNIIFVKMFNKYLPLLHMFGEKPNYSLCSNLLSTLGE